MDYSINANRVKKLRTKLIENNIDCYIILTDDYHASEYVDDYFKEREFISGFDGSAGTLVITHDFSGLWTDGRYFLQAASQLQNTGIQLMKQGEPGVLPIPEFLKNHYLSSETAPVIAFDGRTVSASFMEDLTASLPTAKYIIDVDIPGEMWTDRPAFPSNPVWILEEKYSGMSTSEKLSWLRVKLASNKADGILVTALDDVAWLFNYRGTDVHCTPVAMAYAVVTQKDATLYIAPEAVKDPKVNAYFMENNVTLKPYLDVYEDVSAFKGKLMCDQTTLNVRLANSIQDPLFKRSPIVLKKSIKTAAEINNERIAHLKDGIALTKAIYRMKKMAETGEIYKETEMSLEHMITSLRQEQEDYISLSFDSIVATGAHGAIVHYEPTPETDIPIEESFLLIDTGAHYINGTTDVTRTLSIGKVTDEMKTLYTAVLQGHLNIAASVYPKGTRGVNLDILARKELWKMGLDFNHGTGHGVGYILSVHEDPNSIRKGFDALGPGVIFVPGMITSNEPGVYLEGKYGIRIENLVLTVPYNNEFAMGDYARKDMLAFESLTLTPYDRASIKKEMLTEEQIETLNSYHEMVFNKLQPYLTAEEAAWLKAETAPI